MKSLNQLFTPISLVIIGLILTPSCKKEDPKPVQETSLNKSLTDKDISQEAETDHYLGEVYGGGVVFYVDDSKKHGLIISFKYLNKSVPFSNIISEEVGEGAHDMNSGKENTKNIVQQQGHTSSAATLCINYRGGGYKDWYLPSINELQTIQNNRQYVSPVLISTQGADPFISGFDWSSSEVNAETAWVLSCSTAYPPLRAYKYNDLKVRAVRKF